MDLLLDQVRVDLCRNNIVKDISLSVKKGEFVGLLGPNGSGKSTLLRTAYRVIKPTSGTILLGGENLQELKLSESAKALGVVSQFNHLNFDLTVFEIVMLGRTPHKTALSTDQPEDYAIAWEALRQVGMEDYADRSFTSLSGGEKQRIILARTLAQQPQILVLDEPTNHLDIKYQLQLLSIVKSLGIGVLAALHDLNLACMYCDTVYVLKGGKLAASGPPDQILTPELVRDVYEIDCSIYKNPATGYLSIVYCPGHPVGAAI
ncbi:ABC transporter ATP-binding protein [Acetonema longum]|uniref:Iron chelate uptake ABC transporter ATP-binding protein n=1 Tax=Acetonema longum DSM 6540 TaxID=1009370 RepID=F7NET8_9FIRM|nr:ABC transporter ATP-binding protein [Acetonema longum]EGO65499.1 iron chelate uptake ABC transporter ATP-binding protein [Acetonema longum DSM 6540]